jgi:hypothetical protein
MNLSDQRLTAAQPGMDGWTRHISQDLFPGATTPYAWTLLAAAADDALRGAYRTLNAAELPPAALWQRSAEGRVYLDTAAITEADASLRGAAWLGPTRPAPPTGFVARLQSGGTVRRVQSAIAAAIAEAPARHARLLSWLQRVRTLRWTQADLLQVMEELEPHARTALQAYFILRAGLPAADSSMEDRESSAYLGTRGLPTVDAVAALAEAARLSPDHPMRGETLARYGHRGPGEIGPAAHRWIEEPELLNALSGVTQQPPDRRKDAARREVYALVQAADIAWDALTVVAAASQWWVQAAAKEALTAGLIAQPADVLYLELEELKQVATGEWHRGRSDTVQEQVAQRRAAMTGPIASQSRAVPQASRGAIITTGPAYLGSPPLEMPPAGAVWLSESLDPGCAPFWPAATAVVSAAADPWSPGVIVARALGVPCITGAAEVVASAQPGQVISI